MAKVEQGFFDRTQAVDSDGAYTTASVPYFAFNSEDEDDAINSVYEVAEETFNGLVLDSVEIDERINETTFKVVVKYKAGDDSSSGGDDTEIEPVFTFDTGGGTQHITQSLLTVGKYPPEAADFGGAIGYDGESVAGVDIVQPVQSFSETHYLKDNKITTAYKKGVSSITGTMNNDAFRGYNPGEVLFLGASGTRRGTSSDSLWDVTYKFSVSPNRKNFKVGDITVTEKYGWDYMWVRYADHVDDAKKTLLKKPVAVYIERVYKIANFGALGIGT